MKKLMMTLMAAVFAITANAQYNVGTSSKYTDSFGNSVSTHRNQYGMTTGTSSSFNDGFTATRQPPTLTHAEGARARQVPTGMPSGTPQRPTGTTSDKALGRHRAILIHSETRPPSSEAITATLPSGHGNEPTKYI